MDIFESKGTSNEKYQFFGQVKKLFLDEKNEQKIRSQNFQASNPQISTYFLFSIFFGIEINS